MGTSVMTRDTLHDVDKIHKQCRTISYRQPCDFGFTSRITKGLNRSKKVG